MIGRSELGSAASSEHQLPSLGEEADIRVYLSRR